MYLMFGSLALCFRMLLGAFGLWVLVPLCFTSVSITTKIICGLVSLVALEAVLNVLKDVLRILREGLDALRDVGKRALLHPPAFLYIVWLASVCGVGHAWYHDAQGTQGALMLVGAVVSVAAAVVSMRCFLQERAGTSFMAYGLWLSQLVGLGMLTKVTAGISQAWTGLGILAVTAVTAELLLQLAKHLQQRKGQQASVR